jgi:hypothetical protein
MSHCRHHRHKSQGQNFKDWVAAVGGGGGRLVVAGEGSKGGGGGGRLIILITIDPEEVGPPGVWGFSKKKKNLLTQPLVL